MVPLRCRAERIKPMMKWLISLFIAIPCFAQTPAVPTPPISGHLAKGYMSYEPIISESFDSGPCPEIYDPIGVTIPRGSVAKVGRESGIPVIIGGENASLCTMELVLSYDPQKVKWERYAASEIFHNCYVGGSKPTGTNIMHLAVMCPSARAFKDVALFLTFTPLAAGQSIIKIDECKFVTPCSTEGNWLLKDINCNLKNNSLKLTATQ